MKLTIEKLMLIFNALDDRLYLNDKYPDRCLPMEDKNIEELKDEVRSEIEHLQKQEDPNCPLCGYLNPSVNGVRPVCQCEDL